MIDDAFYMVEENEAGGEKIRGKTKQNKTKQRETKLKGG